MYTVHHRGGGRVFSASVGDLETLKSSPGDVCCLALSELVSVFQSAFDHSPEDISPMLSFTSSFGLDLVLYIWSRSLLLTVFQLELLPLF